MLVLISEFFLPVLKQLKSFLYKNEVTNYRPISILSIFPKILEKLVHTRTLSFLKSHSVLTQYGFRPKYSTLHAVLDITDSALY